LFRKTGKKRNTLILSEGRGTTRPKSTDVREKKERRPVRAWCREINVSQAGRHEKREREKKSGEKRGQKFRGRKGEGGRSPSIPWKRGGREEEEGGLNLCEKDQGRSKTGGKRTLEKEGKKNLSSEAQRGRGGKLQNRPRKIEKRFPKKQDVISILRTSSAADCRR